MVRRARKRFRPDYDVRPNAKSEPFHFQILQSSVRMLPRLIGLQDLLYVNAYDPINQSRKTKINLRSSMNRSIQPSEFQRSSDAPPILFEAAQWNIKQSRDCRGHFKADITSLTRDRARIPHLTHRGDHERKAQNTRS
jgi:hypothetical protein